MIPRTNCEHSLRVWIHRSSFLGRVGWGFGSESPWWSSLPALPLGCAGEQTQLATPWLIFSGAWIPYNGSISNTIVLFNSAFNPVIYPLVNERFKEKFKAVLCCSWRRLRVHPAGESHRIANYANRTNAAKIETGRNSVLSADEAFHFPGSKILNGHTLLAFQPHTWKLAAPCTAK